MKKPIKLKKIMKPIKLKKIVIDIKGKEISLTIEEAHTLREELGKLTQKETVWYPTVTCGTGSIGLSSQTLTSDGVEYSNYSSN